MTSEIEAKLLLASSADNTTLQSLLDPFLADPGVALEAWNKQPKEVLSKFRILLGDSVEEFVVDPTTGSYHIQGMQAGGGFVTTRHTCGGVQCCEHSLGVALAPTDSLHLSSLRGRSIRRAMRRSIRALAAASSGSVSDTASPQPSLWYARLPSSAEPVARARSIAGTQLAAPVAMQPLSAVRARQLAIPASRTVPYFAPGRTVCFVGSLGTYDGIKSGWIQEMSRIRATGGRLRYVSYSLGDVHEQFLAELNAVGAGQPERWLPASLSSGSMESGLGGIRLSQAKLLALQVIMRMRGVPDAVLGDHGGINWEIPREAPKYRSSHTPLARAWVAMDAALAARDTLCKSFVSKQWSQRAHGLWLKKLPGYLKVYDGYSNPTAWMQLADLNLTKEETTKLGLACGASESVRGMSVSELQRSEQPLKDAKRVLESIAESFVVFGIPDGAEVVRWLARFSELEVGGIMGCDMMTIALENDIADALLHETARVAGARATVLENCGVNRKHDARRTAGYSVVTGHSSHARDVMAVDFMGHGWAACRENFNLDSMDAMDWTSAQVRGGGAAVPPHGQKQPPLDAKLSGVIHDLFDSTNVGHSKRTLVVKAEAPPCSSPASSPACSEERCRSLPMPTVTMHLGADPDRFYRHTAPAARTKGTAPPTIGYLGRLGPEKGLVLAMRAWAIASGARPFDGKDMRSFADAIAAAWCGKPARRSRSGAASQHGVPVRIQTSSGSPVARGVVSCANMHDRMRQQKWHESRAIAVASTLRLYLDSTTAPDSDTTDAYAEVSGMGAIDTRHPSDARCRRSAHVARALQWAFPALDARADSSDYCGLVVELPATVPHGRFKIIGSGLIFEDLQQLARSLNCSDTVQMLGSVFGDKLASELSEMSAMIFPSLREESETFGVSNLESLLTGVPFISMGLGGSVDYTMHGFNSLIVPQGDALPMALQMMAFMKGRAGSREDLRAMVRRHGHSSQAVGERFARLGACLTRCPRLSEGLEDRNSVSVRVERLIRMDLGKWSYAAAMRAGSVSVASLLCAQECAASHGYRPAMS